MRHARYKSDENAFYHILTRVAGSPGFYPLQKPEACRKLIDMLYFYVRAYCCTLVSFEIMGSHYHFILWMEQFRRLCPTELQRRARLLWGDQAEAKTAAWSDPAWQRFNRKLFDLSAFMQHLNGEYAKWYNRRYGRRGHFWADRFKNPQLLDLDAVQACLLYIETNACRARLVEYPEQWQAGSAWRRSQGLDEALMPLARIFADVPADEAPATYRERLERRRQADAERQRRPGAAAGGRQRFFSDGLAIGSAEQVTRFLDRCKAEGRYRRRKHPIPQLGGRLYSAREQRSHARW